MLLSGGWRRGFIFMRWIQVAVERTPSTAGAHRCAATPAPRAATPPNLSTTPCDRGLLTGTKSRALAQVPHHLCEELPSRVAPDQNWQMVDVADGGGIEESLKYGNHLSAGEHRDVIWRRPVEDITHGWVMVQHKCAAEMAKHVRISPRGLRFER